MTTPSGGRLPHPHRKDHVVITITSFGYLHGDPPDAHLIVDLREHFRDPHVSPELRYLTASDAEVRHAVMTTPGIRDLVAALALAVDAYQAGPSAGDTAIAVGCAGGRHRAATVAGAVAAVLAADPEQADTYGLVELATARTALPVALQHRDIELPVVHR
jgi:RNase adaptor protein for sRNA GlmZ degradation